MLIYNSVDKFNTHETAGASTRENRIAGWSEADWGYRLRGEGQPGGNDGGWLVTYLFEQNWMTKTPPNGWLIGFEIGADDARTGRISLLRRDWNRDVDKDTLHELQQRDDWDWNGKNRQGETDINWLDGWLPGPAL